MRNEPGYWLSDLLAWVIEGGIGLVLFVAVAMGVGWWLLEWPGAVLGLLLGCAVGAFFTLAMGDP
jgi:hypothetical protein